MMIYGSQMMSAKRKSATTPETVTMDIPLIGRDEMNLADHPLSVLTDRAHKGTKTLTFRNTHGMLTISSNDLHGMPTAQDADVLVALIQLTKQKNDFREPTVNFTRYELLRLLGWPNEGKNYRRLAESLKRWHGVTLNYDGCWWDNRAKRWGDADIHIIESVVILEGSVKITDDGTQQSLPLSSFEWNRKFIESCQAGNLKYLDLSLYFSLEHPSSKRLYRFLDKRFYLQPDWLFDLTEIAFERVGLSRNYTDAGKLKEKLQPAIEELEGKGFIQPMSREERYSKEGKVWKIRFVQMPPALAAVPQAAESTSAAAEPPVVAELTSRGVRPTTARTLAREHDEAIIRLQMEILDFRLAGKKADKIDDPAAWLISAIREPHQPPKGFISKAERQKREEAKQARERQAAEERRQQQEAAAQERAVEKAIDAYWKALTAEQQVELDAALLAATAPEVRALEDGSLKELGKTIRRREYIRQLLSVQDQSPVEA
jgi:Replication initiator protein A